MVKSKLLLALGLLGLTGVAGADSTYHTLANGSFTQDWTNTSLITLDDDWSGVPSIEGHLGDGLTGGAGTDPRTILGFGTGTLDLIANNTDPSGAQSGGVYEVEGGAPIAGNPTIAFQGSGTADAPFVLLRLNTTGCTGIQLSYTLRDIDTAETTANQQVVVQGRVGESGNFAEIPGTYVAVANNNSTTAGSVSLAPAYENTAQVQLRWLTSNAANVDAMIGIDDIQVTGTCTGGVDNPPAVSSTSPLNNATGVQPAANLSVQFSEVVTTSPDWFALNCSSSGAVSVAESGTGSSRSLDPVLTLSFGEVCTATITAAKVIDTDGTLNPMTANYQWSFTVLADNPPTVSSTAPTNGVASVPVTSNIGINFSEPVTVSGSWYSIVCANSGAHPAVVSGGPSNYSLNPDTDFDLLEQCTVTLTAAQILDQDGTPDPLASNYVFSFTTAASASNYYANVDASNQTVLRTTLHATIDDHLSYSYSNGATCNIASPSTSNCDVWDMVETAEQNPANPAEVLDIYRNRAYTKGSDRAGTGSGLTYNREHSWPNSLGFNDVLTLDGFPYGPYTDGHMLFASDTQYNADRGNKPFDTCDASCTELVTLVNNGGGGTSGTYPGDSNWVRAPDGNTGTFEVWRKRKGDLARAILYMDVRYEGGTHANGQREPDLIATNNRSLLQITPSGQYAAVGYMAVLDTLIAWHQADPPDAQEVLRNEVIFSFQGNRNPFIDHPEWVACLFQNQCTVGENVFANGFE